LQITATPGPRAMRASKARQVTATTCPLVDIQHSFCSRSASGYFVGNLPQKVKLVNGLTLDLPIRDGHLAAKTRLAGCGTSACFFPRLAGHPSADSAVVWATLSLFLGRFDVPPTPLLVRPSAMTAVAVPAAANQPESASRTRTDRVQAAIPAWYMRRDPPSYNAHEHAGRAHSRLSRRPLPGSEKTSFARERFGRARIRLRDAMQARR